MMEQLSTAATVQRTVSDDRNLLHRRYATLDVATNG